MEDQSQPQQEGFIAKMLHRFGGGKDAKPIATAPIAPETKFVPVNATTEMKVAGPGLNFGKASIPEQGQTITPMTPEATATPIVITPVENKSAA